jgi:hypothetical protein
MKLYLFLFILVTLGLYGCSTQKPINSNPNTRKVNVLTTYEWLGDTSLCFSVGKYFSEIPSDSSMRKVIKKNFKEFPLSEQGIFVAKICIDSNGTVLYAKTIPEQTTIQSISVRMKFLKAALGYEYEPSPTGEICECGLITVNVSIN